jgi:multidrug resistance efflux pump
MLEFIIASLVTIFPDYLFRRYVQGKIIGKELTIYSVWYELRYGITACAMLTVVMITLIFYYHPTTNNAVSFFRTVTIIPEVAGRVDKVAVHNLQQVQAGDLLFTLHSDRQRAALATAEAKVKEIEAAMTLAEAEVSAANAQTASARAQLNQAQNELSRNQELQFRNRDVVSGREMDRLTANVAVLKGALDAAAATEKQVTAKLENQLPAQLHSAGASVDQARVELSLTEIRAGVAGTLQQFALQPGDYVSAILRPAGVIVPKGAGTRQIQAGFGQIAAQVVKPGMIVEISCMSHPYEIIPMVIVDVQNVIAAGQFRPTDQLADQQLRAQPGSVVAMMEPLYDGGLRNVPPGSKCVANAYTSNHDRLALGKDGFFDTLFLHAIDAVGLVHAAILRAQTLLLPVQVLVLSGH